MTRRRSTAWCGWLSEESRSSPPLGICAVGGRSEVRCSSEICRGGPVLVSITLDARELTTRQIHSRHTPRILSERSESSPVVALRWGSSWLPRYLHWYLYAFGRPTNDRPANVVDGNSGG